MLIDTHCHLDFPDFAPDRPQVIERACANGVAAIVNIGSSLKASEESVAYARAYPEVFSSIGCHPHEADRCEPTVAVETLERLAKNDKVVAIGEIGLDYFKHYSDTQNQGRLFRALLGLAGKLGLPVVLHCREAQEDLLAMVRQSLPAAAVVHCFSGDEAFLRDCLDLGFCVSCTATITYRKADRLRDIVKLVPLDRLMLETDAPFLPPEGMRGTRNEPANVKAVAEAVARIKEISCDEVAEKTTAVARRFFRLP